LHLFELLKIEYTAMDLRVGRKFRLGPKIGAGNNGEIYGGINVDTGEEIAIKLEVRKRSSQSHLNGEFQAYQVLGQEGMCSAEYDFINFLTYTLNYKLGLQRLNGLE
jgi:hypothetical protein